MFHGQTFRRDVSNVRIEVFWQFVRIECFFTSLNIYRRVLEKARSVNILIGEILAKFTAQVGLRGDGVKTRPIFVCIIYILMEYIMC